MLESELKELGVGCLIKYITPLQGKDPYFRCNLFDGEPMISNGVGHVSNWKEVTAEAATIEEAIQTALDMWRE